MATIKITADTTAAESALKTLDTSIKNLQTAASKVKIEIKADGIEALEKRVDSLTKKMDQYSSAAGNMSTVSGKVTKTTTDFSNAQEKVGQAMSKTAGDTQKVTKGMNDTGEAIEQADKKMQSFIGTFVKSAIIYQAIYSVRQVFLDALDTMKQVDSQLVTVRKVTQATAGEINQLRDKAYATASKYGVGAADYLESVANFARAGYKDQSDALAELSTKTQIVGDTTAEVANQFLLSMDAAYKYEGSISKLTAVLDGANEIDNNYATSIEKIAEGLGLIAPIAAQVHMTEAELTAAIGTITATTQRSGSEAARALRALILNIIGDTTTEIEDGVTATEESVKSLQGLLKRYAPDAVAAAEATGEIIDPMKAIAALHKSMKEGFLTEQELMEQLSALGGKLRTSQLVALVSNFDMYEEMLGKYSNAVGSADREVENALDSWERKAAILANTWTEFIQGSLDTGAIKGFIDGLTQVLRLFGNLGNMLITVGGAFVALKLPALINSFKALKTSVGDFGKSLGSAVGGMQRAQLAIAAITTAISVAVMAYNAYRQAVEEGIQAANESAESAKTEAEEAYKLYGEYDKAKAAYEAGTGTKDAYKEATLALAEALGIEESQIGQNVTQLERYTQAEIEAAKKASELAIKKRMDDWKQDTGANPYIKYGGYAEVASAGENRYWDFEASLKGTKSYLDRAKAIVKTYDDAVKIQQDLADATKNGARMTAAQSEEWEYAGRVIDKYGGYVEELRTNLDNIKELEGLDLDNFEEAADGTDGLNNSLEKTIDQFSSLSKAASEAEEAIQKYKDATKVEKDDTWKGMASAYEEFLTDWEAGLKGSNKVNAAVDLFFPESVQNDLWKQGKSAGEMLASEFYQGIFTYVDENGQRQFTKGEDSGSILAYALWDDDTLTQYVSDTEKVIKLGDEIVASFKMDGDELSVSVDDFDKLAEALYQISGVYLSGDTLAAWLGALGMYSGDIQYTTKELKDLAETAGALKDNKINLEDFVQGALDLGKSKDEVRAMVDKLIELDNLGEIDIDVGDGSVEEAKQKCAELIETADTPIEVDVNAAAAQKELNSTTVMANTLGMLKPVIGVYASDYATSKLDSIENSANSIPRTIDIVVNAVTTGAQNAISNMMHSIFHKAVGTMGAAGGMTLVNELGPEIIQEGAMARIAGGGQPTITWVEPGARIYNANDTKMLLAGNDPSMLYGGIDAFAGGTASGITRWRQSKANAAASSAGTAVASSAARGRSTGSISNSSLKSTAAVNASGQRNTSSSSSKDEDAELKRLKDIVSLRESELELLEAQDASVRDRINKQKQIQTALMDEINRLRAIGGSQEDINKLYTQWYKVQKEIADLQDSLYNELKTAINGQIDKLNEKRDEEKEKIQEQLDALEESRNTRDEQLDLEEKILAVQKAEAALQNAMTERTVRYYNAVTGQWEWAANASNVKSAAEQLESAQKALTDYQDDKAYQNARAELQAQMDAIDAKYDDLEERWDKVVDSLEAPVKSVAEALTLLAKNYVPTMSEDVKKLNSLLEQFGYNVNTGAGRLTYRATGLPVFDSGGVLGGIGGIKATALDEMILPPDITSRMLSTNAGNAFAARMNELRYLYGVGGSLAGITNNSIGTQHNGNIYRFGNISLSDSQARTMTVADLARLSRGLSLYSSRM